MFRILSSLSKRPTLGFYLHSCKRRGAGASSPPRCAVFQALVAPLFGLTVLCAACGGSITSQKKNALFSDIQVAEARLERAKTALYRKRSSCRTRSRALRQAGNASGHICDLARRSEDTDAMARCRHAKRAYGSADAHVHRRCKNLEREDS